MLALRTSNIEMYLSEGILSSRWFTSPTYDSNGIDAFRKIPNLVGAEEGRALVELVAIDDGLARVLADRRLPGLQETTLKLGSHLFEGWGLEVRGHRMLEIRKWKVCIKIYDDFVVDFR